MPTLLMSGPKMNLLARGALSLSGVSSAAAYPVANLASGRPGVPWWAAAAGSPVFTLDGNEILNGGFDSDLTSWTEVAAGGGASTRTTTGGEYHTGPGALKLTPGAGSVSRYQDLEVRAGEVRTIELWLLNGTGTVKARLRDRLRGYYLKSDGTWQAAATEFATGTGAYAKTTLPYTVPSIATLGAGTVTLRLELLATGGTGFADDVSHWAAQDFLSIHGHNLPPSVALTVESSPDAAAWTTETFLAGGVVQPLAFFATWAQRNARHWRYTLTDAVGAAALAIGEMVAGQALTAARPPSWGRQLDEQTPQDRVASPAGDEWVYVLGPGAVRTVRLPWLYKAASVADWEEMRDALRRCRHGVDPVVIVSQSTRPDVIFGRLADGGWASTWQPVTVETPPVVIRESPGPVYGL